MAHETHPETPEEAVAWKSVKWRTYAGWVVVAIIAWRYLIHPISSAVLVAKGYPHLPPIQSLDLADAAALVGLPLGGAFADKMTGDT